MTECRRWVETARLPREPVRQILATGGARSGGAPPRLDQPRGVARHLIDLEVDSVAGLAFAPGRHRERMRDQERLERVAVDGVDGERGPVERDRALDRDEFRQVLWCAKRKMRHAVEIAPGKNLRRSVDVAANHVTAKLVAHFQRTLEIDTAPCPPSPKRRDREGL